MTIFTNKSCTHLLKYYVFPIVWGVFSLTACTSSLSSRSDCAKVAVYPQPNLDEDLFPVVMTHLDGQAMLVQPSYQLSPGKHNLTLVELISAPTLNLSIAMRSTKKLTVELESGRGYYLAAKYLPQGKNEDFWQPVIWKQEAVHCQFSSETD